MRLPKMDSVPDITKRRAISLTWSSVSEGSSLKSMLSSSDGYMVCIQYSMLCCRLLHFFIIPLLNVPKPEEVGKSSCDTPLLFVYLWFYSHCNFLLFLCAYSKCRSDKKTECFWISKTQKRRKQNIISIILYCSTQCFIKMLVLSPTCIHESHNGHLQSWLKKLFG